MRLIKELAMRFRLFSGVNKVPGVALVLTLLFSGASAQELPTGAVQPAPDRYVDIPPVHWAEDAVERMTALGVLTGYPDGSFGGTGHATRYELAVVAARLVDLLGASLADLIADPDFRRAVEDAAGNNARLIRLEAVAANAANAAYVQELQERIAEVEEYLNQLAGERLFPGFEESGSDTPLHADGAVGALGEQAIASITSQLERQIQAQEAEEAEAEAALRGLETDLVLPPAAGRQLWFGISGGYPQVTTLHLGMRDLADSLHVRFGVGFRLPDALGLELHALYEFEPLADGRLALYLGAGPAGYIGASGSAASLSVLGGLEYALDTASGPGSVFVEAGPLVDLLPVAGEVGFTARAGLNYRF
jgi:hypothetical protein